MRVRAKRSTVRLLDLLLFCIYWWFRENIGSPLYMPARMCSWGSEGGFHINARCRACLTSRIFFPQYPDAIKAHSFDSQSAPKTLKVL